MIQLTDNIYAVEVPEGARDFSVSKKFGLQYKVYYTNERGFRQLLIAPRDPIEIIGLFNSLSEERARELVDYIGGNFAGWKNYNYPSVNVNTPNALLSLRSLLENKGLTPDKKNYLIIKKIDQ